MFNDQLGSLLVAESGEDEQKWHLAREGKEEEQGTSFGPRAVEGESVFGVWHIFASLNSTPFIHDTDLSGKEAICHVTGGMKVEADRDASFHTPCRLPRM